MKKFQTYYTNWNAGFTRKGKKTYDFKFDRKSTIAKLNVEKMIDDALMSGNFAELGDIYVKLLTTCRHIGHSGPNGYPSKKDYCAVRQEVVDREGTEKKLGAWVAGGKKGRKPKEVKRFLYACKRRMPKPKFDRPTIYRDPFKKELTQCSTAINDIWMNGVCPFSLLLNLNNVDDKLLLDEFLLKTPKIEWVPVSEGIVKIRLYVMKSGDLLAEYILKYTTKGVPNRETKGDVLLAAIQNLEPENAVNMGTFSKL